MTRGRGRSIVERVATVAPNFEGHEEKGAQVPSISSRSISLDTKGRSSNQTTSPHLYPFSDQELDELWKDNLARFNYNCLLDMDDIEIVNDLEIDSIHKFKDNCIINKSLMDDLIGTTDSLISAISNLQTKYDSVSTQTSDFDRESSKLMSLKTGYVEKFSQIETYLKNFESLEMITKNLSRSGYSLIVGKYDFFKFNVLAQLDASLSFFSQHPTIKNIEMYSRRYRQCMTKALTLIKSYLISEINKLTVSLQDLSNKQNAPIGLLIHAEFLDYAADNDHNKFKDLTYEIVKRTQGHNEYCGLYKEVLNAYFNARITLLKVYVTKNYPDTDRGDEKGDLTQISQRKISFFKNVIEKEFKVFKEFFWMSETNGPKAYTFIVDEFYAFLKKILDPLYDDIRLLTLKETNIDTLCNLTTLLQKYYEYEDPKKVTESDLTYFEAINYGQLLQDVLYDVQSRLIFRVQLYIDDKLLKYEPTLSDLKLSNKRSVSNEDATEINELDIDYPNNLFPEVYLPLGKALTLLSSIYELINSVVFDDLAHYVVHSCISHLKGDYYQKSLAHLGPIDTKLNYLKNLMLLNEHLNNFDIQDVRNEIAIDFTGGLNDIWGMIRNGRVETSGGVFELMKRSIPKIINNMVDARHEVSSEMANAYASVIKICTDEIVENIQISQPDLALKPHSNFKIFKDALTSKIPLFFRKVKYSIDDHATTMSIMKGIVDDVSIHYRKFYSHVTENHSEESEPLSELMGSSDLDAYANEQLDAAIALENSPDFRSNSSNI